ncbi:hypothetical protein OsI_13964 [Oryza sativa Indica Group]|uniref:Cupin type-1 domain-containing protein n=1 Tax=Oryza sativa subsp. indica TaxID=39946 RepID=B8ALS3_ORYSI|nr:hypothetical protein OsI_13964 [Oryza sativa Indica Group]
MSAAPLLVLTVAVLAVLASTCAADPEPIQDFCVAVPRAGGEASPAYPGFPCKPASAVVSDDFFFAGLAAAGSTDNPFGASLKPGNVEASPALNTLGVDINRVDLAPGGVNPLHSHPRADELVHVITGRMLVGFVSTAGKYYSQVYKPVNASARALTVFNSQLPGVVPAATALFGADPEIPDAVLAKSFQVDAEIIKLLKSKFKK